MGAKRTVWVSLRIAALLFAVCLPFAAKEPRMADSRIYRPETCVYCQTNTWCELRANGKPQCRACKVERFFELVLYPPLGYRLQEWQRSVLRDLYGTVDERGLRQYRRCYISMAKQNGKSFLLGGLPIYHLLMENELNPEAYGVASAKDQAGIVFKAASMLVDVNPLLRSRLKVLESTKRIVRRDGGGTYIVLSADGDVQDGKRPSLLMFDELHRFTRKKAETVRTVLLKGMISRAPVVNGIETGEPLMLQTTTSGDEYESPLWFSEYEHAQSVVADPNFDSRYYARIWQADPKRLQSDKEYWMTREARVAANPSHEQHRGFLADRSIEAEMLEAVKRPEKYGDYVRLNLNVPAASTETPAVNMHQWYANAGPLDPAGNLIDDLRKWPEYDVELLIRKWHLQKQPCYIGVDLAWTTDMTGMSLVFPPVANELDRAIGKPQKDKWKLLFFSWLPEGRISDIEKITRQPLASWVKRGFVSTVPGVKMSLLAIEDKIRWAAKTFEVREICYDPWGQLTRSMEILAAEGFTCVEINQKMQLTHATKEFLAMYMNSEFCHGNNPVANWHVSCLSLERDKSDNVRPSKPARDISKKRIDLVAATVDALARATVLRRELADDLVIF